MSGPIVLLIWGPFLKVAPERFLGGGKGYRGWLYTSAESKPELNLNLPWLRAGSETQNKCKLFSSNSLIWKLGRSCCSCHMGSGSPTKTPKGKSCDLHPRLISQKLSQLQALWLMMLTTEMRSSWLPGQRPLYLDPPAGWLHPWAANTPTLFYATFSLPPSSRTLDQHIRAQES